MKENDFPAFPYNLDHEYNCGMTIRDYFAGKALQGLITNAGHGDKASDVAKIAYAIADALLKERRK